ncbi:PucR family transcriptional regulator [Aquibacillus sediminis]|uniref:PucR family transcriptional regulator n=1 Tax=Aquibacillus sediminis TaxID=2574734 RepID=UPI0011093C49|nr:PucR family transcriptional regulator [Aquibacillus sediminis]
MYVLIEEIMKLDSFSGSKVVAGENGLDRKITSVTVSELPDAPEWLVGGELVMTTGYYMKENGDHQVKWLKQLIEKGASALAIKPGRFIGSISQDLMDVASEYRFPLIELPLTCFWSDLIKDTTELIQNSQNYIIKKTEEIHKQLTDIVLQGKGIQEIADTLSYLVKSPIVVEDFMFKTMAVSEDKQSSDYMNKFIEYRQSEDFKNWFKRKNEVKDIINFRENKIITININYEGKEMYSQITFPIIANHVLYGFISLISKDKKINEVDKVALEHGSTTIALDMMKNRITLDYERRMRNLFLNELIDGNVDKAIASYRKWGFVDSEIFQPTIMVIFNLTNLKQFWMDKANENFFIEHEEEKTFQLIKSCYMRNDHNVFVNINENICTVIYHYSQGLSNKAATNEVKRLTLKVIGELEQRFNRKDFFAGIGDPSEDIQDIQKIYSTAKTSLELGRKFLQGKKVAVYDELGVIRLLSLVKNHRELEKYCSDLIGELMQHDFSNDDSMCETLDIYLKTNCNIKESAKLLNIHSNTLSYRLKKIKAILQKDLNDSQVRLNLQLALTVKNLFLVNTNLGKRKELQFNLSEN